MIECISHWLMKDRLANTHPIDDAARKPKRWISTGSSCVSVPTVFLSNAIGSGPACFDPCQTLTPNP